MKKILLSILTISIPGFLVYWGMDMLPFAGGIKKEAAHQKNRRVEIRVLRMDYKQ